MLIISNIGDHVWLMTSRQTDPELEHSQQGNLQSERGGDIEQFIDVRMEYAVHEADTWTLVRILIGELNVNLPQTTRKRCCRTFHQ